MWKCVLLVALFSKAIVHVLCEIKVLEVNELSMYDYHRKIGIPEAQHIKNCEEDIKQRERIVGGLATDIRNVPYQTGIIIPITYNTTSVCGGALISENVVVTAAHCHTDGVTTAQSFIVVLGSTFLFYGGQRIQTSDITAHPQWNAETVAHDIAIVRIVPVTFSDTIQPIALPSGSESSEDYVGWFGVASGYGITSDNIGVVVEQQLHSVILTIISNRQCQIYFGEWVQDTNICTGGASGIGTCSGDSGGPLAVTVNGRKILVGITSFGSHLGCEVGLPSVYTKLSSYLMWILSTTQF